MLWRGITGYKSKHTIQYTDDVLQNCTPETYVILLTNVTPVNSIENKINIRCTRYPEVPCQNH